MRWDCDRDGCFNIKRRPKIEVFSVCFPNKINFGDVDGLVEINGYFCLLEWKGAGGSIKAGQRYSYEAFTKTRGNIVYVVDGNAETMEIEQYSIFYNGKQHPPKTCNLETLKSSITKWAQWAKSQNNLYNPY